MKRSWIIALALLILLLGVLTAFAAVWQVRPNQERIEALRLADAARGRVHEGMPVAEAESELADAWYHVVCEHKGGPYGDFTDHLFLYGSRDLDLTGVVGLRSEVLNGQEVVTWVGERENYLLWQYDDCTDLDLSKVKRR